MHGIRHHEQLTNDRRGAIVVLAALLLIVIFAMAALAIDLSYIAVTDTQLQNAADASALSSIALLAEGEAAVDADAIDLGQKNRAAGENVDIAASDVELGVFSLTTHTFTPGGANPNAVRVTARVKDKPTFFAPIIGIDNFTTSRSAVAMIQPRDIVFCVDLSGSMNDDTEPCWATSAISDKLSSSGYGGVASDLMQQVYTDLGFGAYPGAVQYIGLGLANVPQTDLAYAVMTQDGGPLTLGTIASTYRISNTDSEATRKKKAYSWIIDKQLAPLMPAAKPFPQSSNTASYTFWEKYLDYIIQPKTVGTNPPSSGGSSGGSSGSGGSGGGGGGGSLPSPPSGAIEGPKWWNFASAPSDRPRDLGQVADVSVQSAWLALQPATTAATTLTGVPRNGSTLRVTVPTNQDSDRITGFNNPNTSTFPTASSSLPRSWRNKVGYVTYVQFMMDWGRDRSPNVGNSTNAAPGVGIKTQLSVNSPYCRYHDENTAGGTFSFPPSEQPTHALRRSLIAAINEIKLRNVGLGVGVGDRVGIVTFDAVDAYHSPQIVLPLTDDYHAAMLACTKLQALSDIGNSTATENGIILARNHLKPTSEGGAGRTYTTKVLVLLTDGVPNVWESSATDIGNYIAENPSSEWYGADYVWYNSALMQTSQMAAGHGKLFPVGMGLGCDYDFMDRLSRIAGTDDGGFSPRGSGNPADYEGRLVEIFKDIINTRGGRLVK